VCRTGEIVHTIDEARSAVQRIGLPCVVRPSFTLGGSGSAIAYNRGEFDTLVQRGLDQSPIHEVLIEESVLGWKEYEMEVMRDLDDNVVIICCDRELRSDGRPHGRFDHGGPGPDADRQGIPADARRQLGRDPRDRRRDGRLEHPVRHPSRDGRMVVIEMNPRVSRSSALASKATGFPIAKIAAKLAVGYRLHELANDITRKTKACFEPTIDYVVTKIPRFAFEKFPEADETLTTQMKSVGETMAIGRTFKESLQKALRGLEVGSFGLGCDGKDLWGTAQQPSLEEIRAKLATPNYQRIWYLRYAIKAGMTIDEIYRLTWIDPGSWTRSAEIIEMEERLRGYNDVSEVDDATLREAKRFGFSDRQLATCGKRSDMEVREYRKSRGIVATFKSVDTCAAEFEAYTPYYYSTYEDEDETPPKQPGKRRIMILGGGPNRIGQGIEFDYCCCHASFALREMGIESIMVNSNPETVSTDYDTSDLLFFEPLTTEDVLNICDRVQPDGVIVQFGGQTPLNLARALDTAGVPIIGTSVDTIEAAEDREKFAALLRSVNLKQPANGIARTMNQARTKWPRSAFPALVRPSFVLGAGDGDLLRPDAVRAVRRRSLRRCAGPAGADRPLPGRRHRSGRRCHQRRQDVCVMGIMEHIEEAGVHSGDSACSIPPYSCRCPSSRRSASDSCDGAEAERRRLDERAIRGETGKQRNERLRAGSQPAGQPHGAVRRQGDRRAGGQVGGQGHGRRHAGRAGHRSRADPAARVDQGERLPVPQVRGRRYRAGARDAQHGRSDGRQRAVFDRLCQEPDRRRHRAAAEHQTLFVSVAERHKEQFVELARRLVALGFKLIATDGTARRLEEAGIPVERVKKIAEGHPNLIDYMIDGKIGLVMNTPSGKGARTDEGRIRAAAVQHGVSCITTIQAAEAVVRAMEALRHEELTVEALQDRFPKRPCPSLNRGRDRPRVLADSPSGVKSSRMSFVAEFVRIRIIGGRSSGNLRQKRMLMDTETSRLAQQVEFIVEIDKLKQVYRRTWLIDASRHENDAEHSWHLGVMAVLLVEHARSPQLDLMRVLKMVLIHDLVEIDAGDTFAYDDVAAVDKADRERAAADRLFNLLPTDQAAEFRAVWDEFEARQTPEAQYAAALDRFQPMLHNYRTQGKAWQEHGITADRVLARNRSMAEGSPALWQYAQQFVADAVAKGYLAPPAEP
jgi:carbamoyl-phosphate synthase large subunit